MASSIKVKVALALFAVGYIILARVHCRPGVFQWVAFLSAVVLLFLLRTGLRDRRCRHFQTHSSLRSDVEQRDSSR